MHGYGDDESAWLEVGRANCIADNLLAQKKMQPMIIAMPYGHPLPIELGVAFDDYADRNMVPMEKDVLQDLLPYRQRALPDQAGTRESSHRGVVDGRRPVVDHWAQALGPVRLGRWIQFSRSARETLTSNSPVSLSDVAATNKQLKLLWIGCGEDDFLLERNQQFIEWLKRPRH